MIPLGDVVAALRRKAAEVLPGMERVVGTLMGENAEMSKHMIGREDVGWVPLKDATVEEKERLGFVNRVSATDPNLRTGELQKSVEPVVHLGTGEVTGEVGTDIPYAREVEHGSIHMPARPFLSPPFATMEPRAALALGKLAQELLNPSK